MSGSRTQQRVPGELVNVEERSAFDSSQENKERLHSATGEPPGEKALVGKEDSTTMLPRPVNGAITNVLNHDRDMKSCSLETQDTTLRATHSELRASKLSELELSLNSTVVEACATAEKLERSETECKALRKQIIDLTRNLQDQQDFIFSLQPRRETFTGTDAAAEFKSLYGSIEEWVQTTLGNSIEDKLNDKIKSYTVAPANDFLALISQPGQEAFGVIDTDIYLVIAAIMKFLCSNLFDKNWYCPIGKARMEFIMSLEKSMGNLQPRRDLLAQRSWYSETLAAMANLPDFAQSRRSLSNTLTMGLTHMLHMFVPSHVNKHALSISIRGSIVEPSMSFAHRMHLSIDRFSLEWSQWQKTSPPRRSTNIHDYQASDLVELLRGGGTKPIRLPTTGERRSHLTYLFDLCPQLVYEPVAGDAYKKPQIINKGRILAVMGKEGEGPYVIPRVLPGKMPTLIGWLDDQIHPTKAASRWKNFI